MGKLIGFNDKGLHEETMRLMHELHLSIVALGKELEAAQAQDPLLLESDSEQAFPAIKLKLQQQLDDLSSTIAKLELSYCQMLLDVPQDAQSNNTLMNNYLHAVATDLNAQFEGLGAALAFNISRTQGELKQEIEQIDQSRNRLKKDATHKINLKRPDRNDNKKFQKNELEALGRSLSNKIEMHAEADDADERKKLETEITHERVAIDKLSHSVDEYFQYRIDSSDEKIDHEHDLLIKAACVKAFEQGQADHAFADKMTTYTYALTLSKVKSGLMDYMVGKIEEFASWNTEEKIAFIQSYHNLMNNFLINNPLHPTAASYEMRKLMSQAITAEYIKALTETEQAMQVMSSSTATHDEKLAASQQIAQVIPYLSLFDQKDYQELVIGTWQIEFMGASGNIKEFYEGKLMETLTKNCVTPRQNIVNAIKKNGVSKESLNLISDYALFRNILEFNVNPNHSQVMLAIFTEHMSNLLREPTITHEKIDLVNNFLQASLDAGLVNPETYASMKQTWERAHGDSKTIDITDRTTPEIFNQIFYREMGDVGLPHRITLKFSTTADVEKYLKQALEALKASPFLRIDIEGLEQKSSILNRLFESDRELIAKISSKHEQFNLYLEQCLAQTSNGNIISVADVIFNASKEVYLGNLDLLPGAEALVRSRYIELFLSRNEDAGVDRVMKVIGVKHERDIYDQVKFLEEVNPQVAYELYLKIGRSLASTNPTEAVKYLTRVKGSTTTKMHAMTEIASIYYYQEQNEKEGKLTIDAVIDFVKNDSRNAALAIQLLQKSFGDSDIAKSAIRKIFVNLVDQKDTKTIKSLLEQVGYANEILDIIFMDGSIDIKSMLPQININAYVAYLINPARVPNDLQSIQSLIHEMELISSNAMGLPPAAVWKAMEIRYAAAFSPLPSIELQAKVLGMLFQYLAAQRPLNADQQSWLRDCISARRALWENDPNWLIKIGVTFLPKPEQGDPFIWVEIVLEALPANIRTHELVKPLSQALDNASQDNPHLRQRSESLKRKYPAMQPTTKEVFHGTLGVVTDAMRGRSITPSHRDKTPDTAVNDITFEVVDKEIRKSSTDISQFQKDLEAYYNGKLPAKYEGDVSDRLLAISKMARKLSVFYHDMQSQKTLTHFRSVPLPAAATSHPGTKEAILKETDKYLLKVHEELFGHFIQYFKEKSTKGVSTNNELRIKQMLELINQLLADKSFDQNAFNDWENTPLEEFKEGTSQKGKTTGLLQAFKSKTQKLTGIHSMLYSGLNFPLLKMIASTPEGKELLTKTRDELQRLLPKSSSTPQPGSDRK